MNSNVKALYAITAKPERLIIGLMSGTSLDGLDVALCRITGHGLQTNIQVLQFETVPYNEDVKKEIKTVFSKQQVDLEKLTLLNPWIALKHAAIINALLQKWDIAKEQIDIIASHGQTIYHAPKILHAKDAFGNATLQIGDGDHIAMATGIITISDFRQKHIAAGGEGAPLAVYGDYLIFGKAGEDRILLNMGGIANFTFLPGDINSNNIFSTDTGPGNTMMDAYMQQQYPGQYFDADAAVALKGTINTALLEALKQNDFFAKPFPKTTGPELFNLDYLQKATSIAAIKDSSTADTMATLNKFSADTITAALLKATDKNKPYSIFCSGGGIHNPLLMQHLQQSLPNFTFNSTAALQIDPDAKEAVLFALLANECICGDGTYLKKGVAGMPVVSMGKISFPD
ncbi:anhydro-N-acetylmuramic acid kinase [Ferruginibacter sp.]